MLVKYVLSLLKMEDVVKEVWFMKLLVTYAVGNTKEKPTGHWTTVLKNI